MAKEGLEPEVIKIFDHVSKGQNFLLSGGAGSGKTYSLVQVIRKCIDDDPYCKVACMTFTNAAVKEIERRVNHKNLNVTTIHDFLWDNIKSFQKDLKKVLIELINDDDSKIKNPEDSIVDEDYFNNLIDGIQYKEYTRIKDGIISHDEVIELACAMFKRSKLLCDILKDRFKFIFIDEYQDTHPLVVEIFLMHLRKSNKSSIIGFFGDSMQSIYDESIEDLGGYLSSGLVYEVQKQQNRRNPKLVIELANRLRTDGLVQLASSDLNAPNMDVGVLKTGNVKFVHSKKSDIDEIKLKIGWDFANMIQTRELNLTHNLIAPKAGFKDLMEIYDRDKILDYKNRITDHIKSNNISTDFSDSTFGQVIDSTGVRPTPMQQDFITANSDLYEESKRLNFGKFSKIYLDKDALVDDKKRTDQEDTKKGSKRDVLIKHLFKIQNNIFLYHENKYNEFVRKTEYYINNVKAKRTLKTIISELEAMSDKTIEEVINFADVKGICKKDDRFNLFIDAKEYVYNRVKKLKFSEFQKLYYYLEGHTPFSTQHKIKGEEFDNVLVVLNNGGWNNYNFQYLFDETIFSTLTPAKKTSYPKILSRTQKIFYVCCTRAKENLVIFYHDPNPQILVKAISWFGKENVIEV